MAVAAPHPVSAWCSPCCTSPRPAAGQSAPTVTGARPIRMIERTFDLSVRGPGGWAVDAAAIDPGLPQQPLCLYALRRLLHRAASHATRDAAWRHLVERARREPNPGELAALGMAAPGLMKIVRQLAPGDHDVESSAIEGFLLAIRHIDLGEDRVFPRLYNAAHSRARAAVAESRPQACGEVEVLASSAAPPPLDGHPDLVLARLVGELVISRGDAHLIGKTRLEGVAMRDYAAATGATYRAVRHQRMRAERRLLAALHADMVDDGRQRRSEA